MQLANFGDSSINILVSAYLVTNVYAEFLQMQNDLNLNIMDIMQADGVDFAFPSTSVYIEKTPDTRKMPLQPNRSGIFCLFICSLIQLHLGRQSHLCVCSFFAPYPLAGTLHTGYHKIFAYARFSEKNAGIFSLALSLLNFVIV